MLSKQQAFSIFLAVLMVGSILGVITYTQDTQNNPPPINPDTQQPTTITYTATSQGRVLQVFPTAVLLGYTKETSAASLESKVRAVPGIASLSNSQFIDSGDETVNFRSEIRFSSVEALREAFDSLEALDSVSNVQLYPQALIYVPGELEFKNNDLGLTQSYTFPNSQVQAFVGMGTQKDDNVMISIQAQFSGQNFSNAVAFEQGNLTSSPQLYITAGTFTIFSLENEFFVRARASLSNNSVLEDLKDDLVDVDANAQLEIGAATTRTKIAFSEPEKIFVHDLNTFLAGFGGIANYSIDLNSNSTEVEFDAGGDYNEFRNSLQLELNSLGFTVASIEEPEQLLQGSVKYPEGKQTFLVLIGNFSATNPVTIEVLQKATIKADSIFVEDANASIPVKGGSFDAFVKNTRTVDENVTLSILLVGTERDGASEIEAQEAEQ